MKSVLFICLGASTGALLRWFLGLALNAVYPIIPLGTLVANLLGGYIIGVAISFFATFPHIGPEWRLLVITGFLGALTTFSTFSAEVTSLLHGQRLAAAAFVILLHVCGSILMTILGAASFALVKTMLGTSS